MDKKIEAAKEYAIFFALILFAAALSFAAGLSSGVTDGLKLFAACVLPSVFPYVFVTSVISSLKVTGKICNKLSPPMKRFFNLGGVTGYAFFMSVLAGYPMGAKIVSDMRRGELLSPAESVRAAVLCSTSSPMFLIASVGGVMFNDTRFGALLLACNFSGAVITGFLFSFYKRKEPLAKGGETANYAADDVFGESVNSAINSSLFVGGVITLFYVFIETLIRFKILAPLTAATSKIFNSETLGCGLIYGLIEYTRGLKAVSSAGISFLSLPVSAFICGFGGLSVLMQSVTFLKKAKIKTAPFILGKLLCAVLNFVLGIVFAFIFYRA